MAPVGNHEAMPLRHRLLRRLVQLHIGLILYGVSMAMLLRAGLGLDPWDVFHLGMSNRTGLRFGWIVIATGVVVLLLWIPLRQRPGLGTVANAVVIGLAVEAALAVIPAPQPLPARVAMLAAAVVLNAVATAAYIGARLGPGPRDGLMTGMVSRYPRLSIRLVRTTIEVLVLGLGWLLGGTVGVGTVVYALSIGPLTQLLLPWLTVPARPAATPTGQPADKPAPPPGPAPGPATVTGAPIPVVQPAARA